MPKPITFHGKTYRTIGECCAEFGVKQATYSKRISRGFSIEQALGLKEINSNKITLQGVEYESTADAARKNGISPETLHSRLSTNMDENKLFLPTNADELHNYKRQPLTINGIKFASITECANHYNFPVPQVSMLKKKHNYTYEDAVYHILKNQGLKKSAIDIEVDGLQFRSISECARYYNLSIYQVTAIRKKHNIDHAEAIRYILDNRVAN